MLRRSQVAQEVRAVHAGEGAADGSRDVVIARRDVCGEEAEDIVGDVVAQLLLQLHRRRDLIERNVARTFDHDLNVRFEGALR